MAGAVETALGVLIGQISAGEATRIAGLLAELRAALGSGELQRLKHANAGLDKATEPLAAMLLERAIADAEASPAPQRIGPGVAAAGAGEG
jgi:hypothetical protein